MIIQAKILSDIQCKCFDKFWIRRQIGVSKHRTAPTGQKSMWSFYWGHVPYWTQSHLLQNQGDSRWSGHGVGKWKQLQVPGNGELDTKRHNESCEVNVKLVIFVQMMSRSHGQRSRTNWSLKNAFRSISLDPFPGKLLNLVQWMPQENRWPQVNFRSHCVRSRSNCWSSKKCQYLNILLLDSY